MIVKQEHQPVTTRPDRSRTIRQCACGRLQVDTCDYAVGVLIALADDSWYYKKGAAREQEERRGIEGELVLAKLAP